MSALSRWIAALVLAGVLADASACIVAFTPVDEPAGQLAISALCPCGCKAHTGGPVGIGLGQLAAPPAESLVPPGTRAAPALAALPALPSAPTRRIDHVPIALA